MEHLPGVAESLIEAHEKAAKLALILTLTSGVAAFGALWFQKFEKNARRFNTGVACVTLVSMISLLYTAKLGGEIRHSEIRSAGATQGAGPEGANETKGDDD